MQCGPDRPPPALPDDTPGDAPGWPACYDTLRCQRIADADGAAIHDHQTQTQTASPAHVVILLYEGLIRFCTTAGVAAHASDSQGRCHNLLRAHAIITELAGGLDDDQGGERAVNLVRGYDDCHRRLVNAASRPDPAAVREVCGLMGELLPAWRAIARWEQAALAARRSTGVAI